MGICIYEYVYYVYIYILHVHIYTVIFICMYIYICVCVCVCVWAGLSIQIMWLICRCAVKRRKTKGDKLTSSGRLTTYVSTNAHPLADWRWMCIIPQQCMCLKPYSLTMYVSDVWFMCLIPHAYVWCLIHMSSGMSHDSFICLMACLMTRWCAATGAKEKRDKGASTPSPWRRRKEVRVHNVAMCCHVLPCSAVCCRALPCVAVANGGKMFVTFCKVRQEVREESVALSCSISCQEKYVWHIFDTLQHVWHVFDTLRTARSRRDETRNGYWDGYSNRKRKISRSLFT